MKIKISKKKIHSVQQLKAQLTKEWRRLSPKLASKLAESMNRRVAALIESNGDYILY